MYSGVPQWSPVRALRVGGGNNPVEPLVLPCVCTGSCSPGSAPEYWAANAARRHCAVNMADGAGKRNRAVLFRFGVRVLAHEGDSGAGAK